MMMFALSLLLFCIFKTALKKGKVAVYGLGRELTKKLRFFSLLRLSLITAKTLGDARVLFRSLKYSGSTGGGGGAKQCQVPQ